MLLTELRLDSTCPPNVDDVALHSNPDMSLTVQDYIFRGDEIEHHSLYELYMWATAVTMSFVEWNRYSAAIRVDPNALPVKGHRYSGDRWQTRVLMNVQHPQIYIGEIRAFLFHKNEKVPLPMGTNSPLLELQWTTIILMHTRRPQHPSSRYRQSKWGVARLPFITAFQTLAKLRDITRGC
jgi:hypothetical protein